MGSSLVYFPLERVHLSLPLLQRSGVSPRTPLAMALFQATLLFCLLLLPTGLTCCQVGRRERQPGRGEQPPLPWLSRFGAWLCQENHSLLCHNSSPPCQAFYTCSSFLFCYFNLPIHIIPIYFLFRKFRKKKSDLLIVPLLFSMLPQVFFPVKFCHHFYHILRGRGGNDIHSIYNLEFRDTT